MKKIVLAALLPLLLSLPVTAQDNSQAVAQLLTKGDFTEAAKLLKPQADAGDALAQYRLGMLYYNGRGVAESEKTAVDLLIKSANQGNVDAMYQLGNAYAFGNDTQAMVADADQEAAQWYFKAANTGNADAQYSLGLLFSVGKGVQKNDKEAAYWMQQAAKNGHKDAQSYNTSTGHSR